MSERRAARWLGIGAAVALVLGGCGDDDSESDVSVSLRAPDDGATVAGAVALEMSATGIEIEAAGEARDGAGHFHVIVDDGCVVEGDAVPKDADHVHFGKGQTSGSVYLEPGEHELCLQVADGVHTALGATDTITVTAGVTSRDDWCKTVGEVDVLFEETDTNGGDAASRKIGYENVRRLLAQLRDGIEQVDAGARDAVGAGIAVADDIAATYIDGTDEEAAWEEVMQILDEREDELNAAAPWIDEACDVQITS